MVVRSKSSVHVTEGFSSLAADYFRNWRKSAPIWNA